MLITKPTLVILINRFDENVTNFLQTVIDTFETEIIILDTRRQKNTTLVTVNTEKHIHTVLILYATKTKALITGLHYFEEYFKDSSSGVILVDVDQNFTVYDIQIVADAMENIPEALIIGGRRINQKDTKSLKFVLSRLSRLTGTRVEDFNSGLRGLPGGFISDLIGGKSHNLDYWIEMYVHAAKNNTQVIEVPLESQHNAKSSVLLSFVLNSSKLVYIFLRFSFLSMVTASIDYAIFTALFLISNSILLSIIVARIVAGSFQFFVGKKWVFKSRDKLLAEFLKYILLVGILMLVSYLFIELMVANFGMNAIISKMIVELSLFIVSFTLQKIIVFAHPSDSKR